MDINIGDSWSIPSFQQADIAIEHGLDDLPFKNGYFHSFVSLPVQDMCIGYMHMTHGDILVFRY